MPFEYLPAEMYINILQYLSFPSLFQCRLLCKSSYSCATDAVFNTFTISRRNIACTIELPRRADLGHRIKTLAFIEDANQNGVLFPESQLVQLYETVCYLKTIDLQQSQDAIFHLKLLCGINTSRLQHVERVLVNRGRWNSGGPPHYCTEEYLQLNLLLRATITHLELFEFDYYFFSNGIQANNILDYLKEFVNLRSLSIKNMYTMFSIGRLTAPVERRIVINLSVVDVLRMCPRLTHLQMYSEYCWPTANASDSNASTAIASATPLVHDAVQKSNVKSLHLMLTEFKFPYIAYVSNHITANLSYLNIQLSRNIRFYSWINDLDPSLLLAFTLRLKTIKHVIFRTKDYSGLYDPVDSTQEHLETQLLNPVNRFISMVLDRFTTCDLELNSFYLSRGESTTIEMLGERFSLNFSFPQAIDHQTEFLSRIQCLDSLHRVFGQYYRVKSIDLQYGDLFSFITDKDLLSFLFTRFDQLESAHVHSSIPSTYISLRTHFPYPAAANMAQLKESTTATAKQTVPSSSSQTLKHAMLYDVSFCRQWIEDLGEFVPNLQTVKLVHCGGFVGEIPAFTGTYFRCALALRPLCFP